MPSFDRKDDPEHVTERPPRSVDLSWASSPIVWLAGTVAGMAIVFLGLGVDAWVHNHSTSDESLLSMSNPGHLIAAIGLALTAICALTGLTIAALQSAETRDHVMRRFLPVTAAWIGLSTVAVGSFTYIAATGATIGHAHSAPSAAVVAAEAGDAGGVAAGLKSQGIAVDGGSASARVDPATVSGALTQGVGGNGSHVHDHGKQPTFTQFETVSEDKLLPLFPANTVSAADFPALKSQIDQVRAVAQNLQTPELAKAAGYVQTTNDVPYMGEHYLNYDLVRKGIFDPAHPQGLLFSKIDSGEEKLVGVWFLLIPGINGVTRDAEPAGFAGNLDLWHAHTGLCLTGLSGASEGETKESCTAKGGSFTADLRWMMHVWVTPETTENPDGVFAYLNNDLLAKQQAATKQASAPTGNTP
jgi:hypothetical protein